jgi:hypothetical protein
MRAQEGPVGEEDYTPKSHPGNPQGLTEGESAQTGAASGTPGEETSFATDGMGGGVKARRTKPHRALPAS